MAGWSTVPVTGNTDAILETQFDEVRAAILERGVSLGLTLTVTDVTTDGDQAEAVLTNYRANIETLIPYYANPDSNYAAYTKTTCLTAALGQADWTAVGTPKTMKADHINELRLVLNTMSWIAVNTDSYAYSRKSGETEGDTGGIATAWAIASADYSTSSYGEATVTGVATHLGYFYSTRGYPATASYAGISEDRRKRISFDVPSGTYVSSKIAVHFASGTTPLEESSGGVTIYTQTGYGGTGVSVGAGGYANAGWYLASMPTAAAGGTLNYSSKPEVATVTNIKASDPTSTYTARGYLTDVAFYVGQIQYTYRS